MLEERHDESMGRGMGARLGSTVGGAFATDRAHRATLAFAGLTSSIISFQSSAFIVTIPLERSTNVSMYPWVASPFFSTVATMAFISSLSFAAFATMVSTAAMRGSNLVSFSSTLIMPERTTH